MLGQQPHRVGEEVVEVKRVGTLELDFGLAPHGRDERCGRVACRVLVAVGRQQPVLGQRDLLEHLGAGGLSEVRQRLLDSSALSVGEQPLDDPPDVGLVIDGVGVGAAEHRGVLAQDARADRVKGRGRHAACLLFAEQVRQPQAKLAGGADAEGDGEDLPRARLSGGEQVRDPVREGLGLAGAGSGDEQQRPRPVADRAALFGREIDEQSLRVGGVGRRGVQGGRGTRGRVRHGITSR